MRNTHALLRRALEVGPFHASKRVSAATWEALERRQLLAGDATPFPEQLPSLPAESVLFANYDNGGEGVGHHDLDRRNKTREYRRASSVDVERVSDRAAPDIGDAPGVGRGVGHTRAGEWLNYTIDVSTGGTYTFELRYAANTAGGTAHLELDGRNITGSLALSDTGGWQRWRTLQKSGIDLPRGQHTLRFVIDSGRGDVANLHWFRFAAEGSANPSAQAGAAKADIAWPTSWDRIKDAPSPRFEAMTLAHDGNLLVFGGFKDSDFNVDRTYAIYNPEKNRWKTMGTLPKTMAETHATPVSDGRYVYFVGGFAGDLRHDGEPTQAASNEVWRYDPDNNRWRELPSLPVAQGAGGTAIAGDQIHFIGGNHEDRVTNVGDHYVLDLSDISGGWATARSMPDPKDHFSTVELNGKIYTIGGEYEHDKGFDTQSSVYVYMPSKDKWKRLADLPIRSGHAEGSAFVHDGQIIFAGGQGPNQEASDRVFAYDPVEDEWRELNRLPFALQGTSVAVFGDKVLVTLGARWTVEPLAMTWVGDLG